MSNLSIHLQGAIVFRGVSTCKFINYKKYQNISENDYVVIMNTGAYGSSLSSNYNSRPIIAEIIVHRSKHRIIRKRQSLESLVNN